MLCALIMAGGKGERFWPLSTDDKPKQFLNLLGKDTMIQMTVKRLEGLIPIERIFVVTAERYVGLVKEQLANLPEENIIVEPVGRNTAPCIALSAFYIVKKLGDVTIAVLPSDHLIRDEEKFREVIKSAYEYINKNSDAIVTLGMKPDRPETGYGYIKKLREVERINNDSIYKVECFVEKPSKEKAEEYFDEGTYLWNGGIFIWKASTILKYTKQYLPKTFKILAEIAAAKEDCKEIIKQRYQEIEPISVDYAIMEKSNDIYVIPCDIGWDDVGSWASLERHREKDEKGNIANQPYIAVNSKRNIIMANKKVILNGVDNIIVVETDDYIIISSKDSTQKIREIKKMIG